MTERRRNPLTGDWVIVSPGRVNRPWQGATSDVQTATAQPWRSDCYLCPRNARAHGDVNPDYRGTFAFDNDFPAVSPTPTTVRSEPLLEAESVTGACRVLCFSERHDATLATLTEVELRGVVDLWREEAHRLGERFAWVQIFENKGEMMGCSSLHPHGQVWATSVVPTLPRREDDRQRAYASAAGATLLVDYANREVQLGERVVVRNDRWLAVVPWWAAWPFETLLLPLEHRASFRRTRFARRGRADRRCLRN